MIIGINLLALMPGISGGIECYIRNLLDALVRVESSNHYVLFTNRDNHESLNFKQSNFHIVKCDIGAYPQTSRILFEQFQLPRLAKKHRLDILHSPSYTWPLLSGTPGVVSILDMLYCVYPESIQRAKLTFWRTFIPASAKRCRKILTISEYSKQDIIRFLGISPSKITVTPLALDRRIDTGIQPSASEIGMMCEKHSIRRPYILDVGGIGNHKNPVALVKALAILHGSPTTKELTLVITGNDYGAAKEVVSCVSSYGLGEVVRLPGYVAREDLPALYAGSFAYVTPSRFEGFGLTVLEAMAFRTPVVVSGRASLPEVAGDAALIVNCEHPNQIADAITRITIDAELRQSLIDHGQRRIKEFSWEHTARLTIEAYREAANACG